MITELGSELSIYTRRLEHKRKRVDLDAAAKEIEEEIEREAKTLVWIWNARRLTSASFPYTA